MALRVCVVSGGRADFGLLLQPMRMLRDDPAFALSVVLTGQHLVAGASDAPTVAAKEGLNPVLVPLDLGGDDPVTISRACGLAMTGYGKVFSGLAPDLILLLGDRYEILCAAFAATIARVPVAHIAGGDVTYGAIDDGFRHAITVLSHLHFATNAESARRILQLGEAPERVHTVGSPGLDLTRATEIVPLDRFFAAIGLARHPRNIIVTFHPVTREFNSIEQLDEMLAAIHALGPEVGVLLTGANADPEGLTINTRLQDFAARHANIRFVASLGSALFFSALTHMDAMVGNSSSGVYEAPTFGLRAVNIGSRQEGRLKAPSVIDVAPERGAIVQGIRAAFEAGHGPVENPYGDGKTSERIVAVLKSIQYPRSLLVKQFQDRSL